MDADCISLLSELLFEVRVLKVALCFLCSCNFILLCIHAKNQRTLL